MTVETPEPISPNSPASEPATNEHDVAIAEAEAAAEIAVAEIEAEAQQAAAETIADALETEAVRTAEEETQWLRDRVAYLEGRLAEQQSPTTPEAETLNLSTPQASSEEPGEITDPVELTVETETTISTPQSTSAETVETPTEVIEESAVVAPEAVAAPVRRKRRLLI